MTSSPLSRTTPVPAACLPGYAGSTCTLCAAGTYSPGGAVASCTSCTVGYTTSGTGATTLANCTRE